MYFSFFVFVCLCAAVYGVIKNNNSGRASELGGIIDLVDRRRFSLGQSSRRKYPYFGDKHSVGRVGGSSHAKTQLDSFSRFDRTPTSDS